MGASKPLTKGELKAVLDKMSKDWLKFKYNVLTRNCHHFSTAVCKLLGAKPPPDWLNSAATGAASTAQALGMMNKPQFQSFRFDAPPRRFAPDGAGGAASPGGGGAAARRRFSSNDARAAAPSARPSNLFDMNLDGVSDSPPNALQHRKGPAAARWAAGGRGHGAPRRSMSLQPRGPAPAPSGGGRRAPNQLKVGELPSEVFEFTSLDKGFEALANAGEWLLPGMLPKQPPPPAPAGGAAAPPPREPPQQQPPAAAGAAGAAAAAAKSGRYMTPSTKASRRASAPDQLGASGAADGFYQSPSTKAQQITLADRYADALAAAGFTDERKHRRLRRFLTRAAPTFSEVGTLHGVLTALTRGVDRRAPAAEEEEAAP